MTDANSIPSIRRAGLAGRRTGHGTRGVFCVPVLPDPQATFQWERELRRSGWRLARGVQFRIPDDQPVLVGCFGTEHRGVTAAEAVALFLRGEAGPGWQVIVPRGFGAAEITRIRDLPQLAGGRYWPEAKGRAPRWPMRGQINGRRTALRMDARWEARLRAEGRVVLGDAPGIRRLRKGRA